MPPRMKDLYFDILVNCQRIRSMRHERYSYVFYLIRTPYNILVLSSRECPESILIKFTNNDYPEIAYNDFCKLFAGVA